MLIYESDVEEANHSNIVVEYNRASLNDSSTEATQVINNTMSRSVYPDG